VDAGAEAPAPSDAGADLGSADAHLPPCACYREAGADYCAALAASHAASLSCAVDAPDAGPNDLLACAGGAWSVAHACASGCATNAAGGDQCTCVCYAGPGDYCGSGVLDAAARFDCFVAAATGHSSDLFTCAGDKDGGVWVFKKVCPNGCVFNPTGSDTCK